MADVQLSVPARPDYVHVLRAVVASAAARLNFTFDEIEDLRLAVDEACAYLLAVQPQATNLSVSITADADQQRLETVTTVEPSGRAEATRSSQQGIIWHILGALTDGAHYEQTPRGPAIRLTKGHHD